MMCATGLFFVVSAADASEFFRNLKQGDRGEDVRALQKILNEDPVTLISTTGPGSYGQETDYFGAKTYDAVVRFQQKYRQNVLIPAGLTAPTGFVGPLTRNFLATMGNSGTNVAVGQVGSQINSQNAPTSSQNTIPNGVSGVISPSISQQNPNLENSDAFLATLEDLAKQKGYDQSQILTMKEAVKAGFATTTDLKRKFLAEFAQHFPVSSTPLSFSSLFPKSSLWDKVMSRLTLTNTAHAQVTGTPFGGRILFTFLCTCTENWLIWLTPLPPSYATLLTYYTGTQAYLSYNLPFALNMLGKYTTGAGQCSFYYGYGCATLPSQGQITPMVGSSSL